MWVSFGDMTRMGLVSSWKLSRLKGPPDHQFTNNRALSAPPVREMTRSRYLLIEEIFCDQYDLQLRRVPI